MTLISLLITFASRLISIGANNELLVMAETPISNGNNSDDNHLVIFERGVPCICYSDGLLSSEVILLEIYDFFVSAVQ